MAEQSQSSWIVPMSAPDLTDAEREAVLDVLRSPRLSLGPKAEAFEEAVADYVGASHAVAVSSGTTGLHLCVRAAGIEDGDLVITTPFSFVASANVMLYERAVPIFVDVDPLTGNLDPDAVAQAAADLSGGNEARAARLPRRGAEAARELKALLPVDVFGQPAEYERLQEVADDHDLALIEDSCEALGAVRNGRQAGRFGDAGVFAFYPNKQITTGEGGVVVTDDKQFAEMVRSLRNQGRAPGDSWLDHSYLGYNYRLSELNAALGVVQMGRIEAMLEARQRVADWYTERLVELDFVETPTVVDETDRMSWFVYVIQLDAELERRQVAGDLAGQGVPSRPYFRPIHLQPYFRERFGYREGDFPVAEDLGRRSLALPFSSVMNESQVDKVVDALRRVAG